MDYPRPETFATDSSELTYKKVTRRYYAKCFHSGYDLGLRGYDVRDSYHPRDATNWGNELGLQRYRRVQEMP